MSWNSPAFNEVKMDAEIGSYQPEDTEREPPVVTSPLVAAHAATPLTESRPRTPPLAGLMRT